MTEMLLALAIGFLAFGLFSKRLERSIITGPLVFATLGFFLAQTGLSPLHGQHQAVHVLAELALVLVLFMDAARIDLSKLRHYAMLPLRMLLFGIPLMVLIGTLLGSALLPGLSWWEVALVAAILAPTDAALGQAVVSAPVVPLKIRQALNVESGLNDGIALPVILILACFASIEHGDLSTNYWVVFTTKQLLFGPLVGVALGIAGAKVIDWAVGRRWMAGSFEGLAALSLAGLCYLLAEVVGGNGFIAAFVGGMTFGNTLRHQCEYLFEFGESEGQLLVLVTFFIFGAALLPEVTSAISPNIVLYAVLSLLVARPLAIALSLVGTKTPGLSSLFLGWFGPRGLASVLFVLLVLEESQLAEANTVTAVIFVTVALSIVLHGISASPASQWYGRRVDHDDPAMAHAGEEIPWRVKPTASPQSNLQSIKEG